MGLRVLPPDINASGKAYIGEGESVRIGLMQIKGLNEETLARILDVRIEQPFSSFDDCWRRARLTPSDARLLILAGCFDSLEVTKTRPELLWEVTLKGSSPVFSPAKKIGTDSGHSSNHKRQSDLFTLPSPIPPKVPQYDSRTLLVQEVEVIGFLASQHPLELYRDRIARRKVIQGRDLRDYTGRVVDVAGWLVTAKVVPTKRDEPMEFVTFEDTTALIETVFFPDAFRKFSQMLSFTKPYRLTGRVMDDFGAITLDVERVEFL